MVRDIGKISTDGHMDMAVLHALLHEDRKRLIVVLRVYFQGRSNVLYEVLIKDTADVPLDVVPVGERT